MTAVPRALLFVPGDRPERFDKACASGADAVIVDLEDAVAAGAKTRARDAVADWLTADRQIWLRLNASSTHWFDDDLALARHPGVAGIVLPKVEGADDVRRLAGVRTIALIESARGMANVDAVAGSNGVERLAFGSIDFAVDLGIPGEGDALLLFRSRLVLASRLSGLVAPIDGVTVAIDDIAALRADAQRARSLGFGGKLCIHPKQVAIVREVFAPTASEVAWAERVVAAADAAGGAAVAVDGAMVDRPVLLRARTILESR
jgi:citrate lyase subunit beta/citryl-CoA lyase